jgi:hypothetical protein
MYKKITMVLTIAAILTAYMSALMLSNQAFAQSAAGQEAKQLPGGHSINPGGPIQLPGGHSINPGGPIQLPGGHSINPGGPILITCIVGKGCIEKHV